MGWFEHGSTIIFFAPPGTQLADGLVMGSQLKMGQALFFKPVS
jgi:phosphatidylserine decarboxylase